MVDNTNFLHSLMYILTWYTVFLWFEFSSIRSVIAASMKEPISLAKEAFHRNSSGLAQWQEHLDIN